MIRTRHLVVLLVVFICTLSAGFVFAHIKIFNASPAMSSAASVILPMVDAGESAQERSVEVIIAKDTTRDEVRERLIAKLRESFVSHIPPVDENDHIDASAKDVSNDVVKTTRTIVRCEDWYEQRSAPWGPIQIVLIEGVRRVSSYGAHDTGVPLFLLDLPENPTPRTEIQCLDTSVVGIGLEGNILQSETDFGSPMTGLRGYARDGFPIFGKEEGGDAVVASELDACGGHIHGVHVGGTLLSMYHYHVVPEAPYGPSCFRGTPVPFE